MFDLCHALTCIICIYFFYAIAYKSLYGSYLCFISTFVMHIFDYICVSCRLVTLHIFHYICVSSRLITCHKIRE